MQARNIWDLWDSVIICPWYKNDENGANVTANDLIEKSVSWAVNSTLSSGKSVSNFDYIALHVWLPKFPSLCLKK